VISSSVSSAGSWVRKDIKCCWFKMETKAKGIYVANPKNLNILFSEITEGEKCSTTLILL
jgi:hypothetical protein